MDYDNFLSLSQKALDLGCTIVKEYLDQGRVYNSLAPSTKIPPASPSSINPATNYPPAPSRTDASPPLKTRKSLPRLPLLFLHISYNLLLLFQRYSLSHFFMLM
ncbi:hypothetical protein DWX10_01915 [Clostridium sp. AF18-27]|nr:hypothetical protein DWX10_01915 [Clostridium sp. AF18-27]